jgi:hypothetical protein
VFYPKHTGERGEWLGPGSELVLPFVSDLLHLTLVCIACHRPSALTQALRLAIMMTCYTCKPVRAAEDEPALTYFCGMECNKVSPKDTIERPEAP